MSMPPQDLRYKSWRTERHLISARGAVCALHPDRGHVGRHHVWRLSNAAGRALREHDAAAGHDDFFLRHLPGLDRIFSRVGFGGRVETARSGARAGFDRRLADGAGDAHLQRRSHAHRRRAAGDGGSTAAHRCASRLRDRDPLRLHRRRCVDSRNPEGRQAAQPRCTRSCRFGIGGDGSTLRASQAISRTS